MNTQQILVQNHSVSLACLSAQLSRSIYVFGTKGFPGPSAYISTSKTLGHDMRSRNEKIMDGQ